MHFPRVDARHTLVLGIFAIAFPQSACVASSDEGHDLASQVAAVGSPVSHQGHIHSLRFGDDSCMDVPCGTDANGAQIQTWSCSDGNNQKFRFEDKGDGYYQLKNLQSGKCLDIAGSENGSILQQWDCSDGYNQQFRHELPSADSKTFALVSRNGNKCIDLPSPNFSNGTNLQVWDCSGRANQSLTAKKF